MKKSEDDWLNLTHDLGDKSIADVCEAFIGATFMQYHTIGHWEPSNWDETVKAVKLFANREDHLMSKWSDYYEAYIMPTYQTGDATASMLNMARQIEKKHPYHFKHPRLLRSAFTHPSYAFMFEHVPNYQRLEFLGDALLDMAFIMHIFYNYPGKDPNWLTRHKGVMVSNKFLAAVCVKLGWYKHLKTNTSVLNSQIRDSVMELEEAEREADGAVDYWIFVHEPPKCLADVIEAYVAAIFVDAEFDFSVVQDFFNLHLKPFFLDMEIPSYEAFGAGNSCTRLDQLMKKDFGCKDWRLDAMGTEADIPGKGKAIAAMVLIHGKVHFWSLGESGRYAKPRACHLALEKLEGLPPYEFRKRYGCDCQVKWQAGEANEEAVEDVTGSDL